MVMPQVKNVVHNHNIKTGNVFLKGRNSLDILEQLLTYQNSIQEEIKCKLSRYACSHTLQNRLSSSLPSKNIKIEK
jgi:hypothetical protein